MHVFDDSFILEQPVLEDPSYLIIGIFEREMLRVPCTKELEGMLHYFFAAKLTSREILEDHLAVFVVELDTFCDALNVCLLELQPPVGLQVTQRWRL